MQFVEIVDLHQRSQRLRVRGADKGRQTLLVEGADDLLTDELEIFRIFQEVQLVALDD